MIATEIWAPISAVVIAVVAYLGGRANADASVSAAWRDFLGPLRKELEDLRTEVGVLRRHEREQAVRAATDSAVLRTSLAASGIEVPTVDVALPRERTRSTDRPPGP